MAVTINIYYTGKDGAARRFAREMIDTKTVEAIRAEDGNERYDYFLPLDDPETILLIDRWRDQEALDMHHSSHIMAVIAEMREKYDLHMRVECYVEDETMLSDEKFIRE